MGRIFTLIIMLASTLLLAPNSHAQESAESKAKTIVEALSERSSQPKLYAIARLNAADAEVCAELAKLLMKMPSATARRMIGIIGESTNASALAALILPLGEDKNEIAADCLRELVSQDLPKIVEIREATPGVDSEILGRLSREGRWPEIIDSALKDICVPTSEGAKTDAKIHRQFAIALFVEAFAGEDSFQYLMDGVFKLIVSSKEHYERVSKAKAREEAARKRAEENKDDSQPEEEQVVDQEKARADRESDLALKRRDEAREMFERIYFVESGFFGFNNSSFEESQKLAEGFWERSEEKLFEGDMEGVKTWSDHVSWASRGRHDKVNKLKAMLLMDKVCGGVTVPTPKQELAAFKAERMKVLEEAFPDGEIPDEALNADDFPKTVAVFVGKTDDDKIRNFTALDARNSQRPRKRGLKAAFKKSLARLHS